MKIGSINNTNFGASFKVHTDVYSDTSCPECARRKRGDAYRQAVKNSPLLASKVEKFISSMTSHDILTRLANLPPNDELTLHLDVKGDYYDPNDGTRKPVLTPSLSYSSEYDDDPDVNIPEPEFDDVVENPKKFLGIVSRELGQRVNINA